MPKPTPDTPVFTPQTPGEEPPEGVKLNKDGSPDKRYTAGGKGRKGRARRPTPAGTINYSDLHDTLKNGAMGVATGILMVTNPQGAVTYPGVVDALETRADKFAASWVAAARADERVARYLQALLSGGVWIAAVGNTLAFGLMVGVFSGRVRTIPIPATFFIPELQPFMAAMPTDNPTTVADNGNQGTGDQEGDGPGDTVDDLP